LNDRVAALPQTPKAGADEFEPKGFANMKKKSPLFKIAKRSDPASMIHKNDAMGELWAAYVDGEPHWIVKLTGLSYTYPVHPEEPESFLVHIVEEAAHRFTQRRERSRCLVGKGTRRQCAHGTVTITPCPKLAPVQPRL
jgi:hypothetical protein